MSGYESINQHPDPRCTQVRESWNGEATLTNGLWRYPLKSGIANGSVHCWRPISNADLAGKILFAQLDVNISYNRLSVESSTTVAIDGSWIAAKANDDPKSNHTIWLNNTAFILQRVGVYTPDDWEHLYALWQAGKIPIPWCAGPRNAAAGVLGPWQL